MIFALAITALIGTLMILNQTEEEPSIETPNVVLKTGETFNVDSIINALYGQGKFLLKDAETDEVLLNNNDIENARVGYYPDRTGTSVYLAINFNKEGTQKRRKDENL